MGSRSNDELSRLPSVDRVIEEAAGLAPHRIVADAARQAVEEARARVLSGSGPSGPDEIARRVRALLGAHERSRLQPVINATGVIVHTNLGRAPMGPEQIEAVSRIAGGYSNLEYDLNAGGRGSRHSHVGTLICALTGAESAIVVNNNAAAVFLVLTALARGRDVVISRGELIEIGGEFRIPEVMVASGAHLVEVGTTNRTRLADYERALTDQTALILKVHPSNYRIVGFTASVDERDLAHLARERGLVLVNDIGSGLLVRDDAPWARAEPVASEAVANGVDLVTFSGDKLLGGPQAGIVAGRAQVIDRLARHPLMRVLRPGKMTLAALDATLRLYLEGRTAEIPIAAMTSAPGAEIEGRARALAAAISAGARDHLKAEAVPSPALVGGGSVPGTEIASWAVILSHTERTTAELDRALRSAAPPIIGRVQDDAVRLDLRTVPPAVDQMLAAGVRAAAGLE